MKNILILDRKTIRKRKRKLFYEKIKNKIKQWCIKQQSKKIIEKIRKEYIRTGDTELILKSKKNISKALLYLQKQKLIAYDDSSGKMTNRYLIYILENENDKTTNNEPQTRQ